MRPDMDVGICLPYMERELDRERLLAWCRVVDAGSFSSLSCGERITGTTLEMRALLAAAAVTTERVRIVPTLYVLPMHSAVWAAKEVATLDVLSGGRVTLGVGVGGREHDYRAVGAPFARRHPRMDEQIALMRRVWAGEPPFEGADPVGPRPLQPGGPPLLAGAMGPKAMARAARWAEGVYVFSPGGGREEIARMLGMADSAWRDADRAGPPRRVAGFWCSLADDAEARLRDYAYAYLRVGGEKLARAVARSMTRHTPEAVRAAAREMAQLGCDELILVPATADLAEVERLSVLVTELRADGSLRSELG